MLESGPLGRVRHGAECGLDPRGILEAALVVDALVCAVVCQALAAALELGIGQKGVDGDLNPQEEEAKNDGHRHEAEVGTIISPLQAHGKKARVKK